MSRNRALGAAGVAVVAGAVAVAVVVLSRGGGAAEATGAVPSVVGLDAAAAEERLVAGGYSTQIVRRPDAQRPAGTVVAQQPGAGRRLDGGLVVLVVSSGLAGGSEDGTETTAEEPVALPKVTGMHQILAGAAVEERGLIADSFPVRDDSECGTVLRQEPAAGTRLQQGEHVRLTVSLGPDPRPDAQVPGLTGFAAAARTAAREFGFTVRTVEQPAGGSQRVGVVLRQVPAALSTAAELSQIVLYVGS